MSWLRTLLGIPQRDPAPLRFVEVGRAFATVITSDKAEYVVKFTGSYHGQFPWLHDSDDYNDNVTTAEHKFAIWREYCGKCLTWSVGSGVYVPHHRIEKVTVRYEAHQVEA